MPGSYLKEFRYNIILSIPVILGMLGHTFVQLADNIMVGQLGAAELAAVSLGNSFVFIGLALGIGFSTAMTPLVAEADGAGKYKYAKSILKHGLVLCTVLGVVLFAVIMAAKPLMFMMRQSEEVVILAAPYLDLVALSLIPLVIFQALKQFSEGLSETKYPMYATIVANVINIVINYLLVFGMFGFPKLGIVGAAVGTLVSRVVMVFHMWFLLQRSEKFRFFITNINFIKLNKSVSTKIINIGFPSALQMFFEVATFTLAIWLSGILGKNAQAANQIVLNLSSVTYMFAMGLGVTAMIRVGKQKGLRNFVELRRIARSIFILVIVIQTTFAILLAIGKDWLPSLYLNMNELVSLNDNLEVITFATELILVAALFQISDGIQIVALGALRGLQDVKIPTFMTFISYWIIGFPTSYYLGLKTDLGSTGIWLGLLVGLTVSAILLYFRFEYMTKKLIATELNAV